MSDPKRQNKRAAGQVNVLDKNVEQDDDPGLCTCCNPRNPLVMRPDFGTLADGTAEYALCVLHEPNPMIYRNRGDGIYAQMPNLSLSPAGDLVDSQGNILAQVAGDSYQRLSTVDDEEFGSDENDGGNDSHSSQGSDSRPSTFHVDLSQDDFYV